MIQYFLKKFFGYKEIFSFFNYWKRFHQLDYLLFL